MATSFDFSQTVFLFNWAANASGATKAAPQQLADVVYCALYGPVHSSPVAFPGLLPTLGSQLYGTDWSLQWGPGVYEIDENSNKADNTAYVVYSQQKDTYIVAIAGTNPAAFLDWFDEDFQVGANDCVNWAGYSPLNPKPTKTAAVPTTAQISYGTAYGVWALGSQLTLSTYAPSTGYATLGAYLQSLTPKTPNTKVIFTGHSLGGALSPTLAYWAQQQWAAKQGSFTPSQVFAMPTAGPTPGNGTYQALWDAAFPQTAVPGPLQSGNLVQYFNNDVWNQLDVVPHAWQYIYTPNAQNTNQPGTDCYMYGTSAIELDTVLATLVPGTDFRKLGNTCQAKGTAAAMTRSAHTTFFPPKWPIQYYSKKGLEQLNAPKKRYIGPIEEKSFLHDLAMIHVWGYGVSAFGLGFDVFTALHPTSSAPAPTAVAVN
jgi:hypothetical protein